MGLEDHEHEKKAKAHHTANALGKCFAAWRQAAHLVTSNKQLNKLLKPCWVRMRAMVPGESSQAGTQASTCNAPLGGRTICFSSAIIISVHVHQSLIVPLTRTGGLQQGPL